MIDNIDYPETACDAGGMTTHDGAERRYMDQLLVASALCPPLG
jgi:hypothetical protein